MFSTLRFSTKPVPLTCHPCCSFYLVTSNTCVQEELGLAKMKKAAINAEIEELDSAKLSQLHNLKKLDKKLADRAELEQAKSIVMVRNMHHAAYILNTESLQLKAVPKEREAAAAELGQVKALIHAKREVLAGVNKLIQEIWDKIETA